MDAKISDTIVNETKDYESFKKLSGNRDVTERRVKAICDSISKIGYQPTVVLCNEHYEVIDGQGRLEACKRLGLPVLFTVKRGIGIDECIAMNIKMHNWERNDFINSYAAQGKIDYIRLIEYIKEYPNVDPLIVAICLSSYNSKFVEKRLRVGTYEILETEDTLSCLKFMSEAIPKIKSTFKSREKYELVLIGLYKSGLIDEDRMISSLGNSIAVMSKAYSIEDALSELQKVYNHGRHQKQYFRDAYLEEMEKIGAHH